ncbi:MAG: hypothetical protein IPI59_01600 [Sphingobacteriales bacterium]|jgi:hypothetical protein|nr:hypothetical protein [Sphingobacteriales bacterium]MDA0200040.1 hypothetical protein [Bacteroidota bacterium]
MTNYKNILYFLLCLSFSIILGASVYEHLAVWPNAFAAPPKSLTMFQGDYKLNPGLFWRIIHPITLLLFIINLIISWKTERKKNVLIAMTGYVLIAVAAFLYFSSEIVSLTTIQYENTINQEIIDRFSLWETLSYFELTFAVVLAFILFMGLTKAADKSKRLT